MEPPVFLTVVTFSFQLLQTRGRKVSCTLVSQKIKGLQRNGSRAEGVKHKVEPSLRGDRKRNQRQAAGVRYKGKRKLLSVECSATEDEMEGKQGKWKASDGC